MSKDSQTRFLKVFAVLVVIGALSAGSYAWRQHLLQEKECISYTSFVDKVNAGAIAKVTSEGDAIIATAGSEATFRVVRPAGVDLAQLLLPKRVDYTAKPAGDQARWLEIALLLLLLVPVLYVMKRMAVFGRSKVRPLNKVESQTLFMDVAGAEEAKDDLTETVDFLKDPRKFSRLGGKMPTGVLLVGPPGTGKTLLARAVAGEAGVPFFSLSGSEFVEMYVGVGASRVRDLFAQARKVAPCIIFIDELDAVGRRRDAAGNGSSDERDQTLNQLLVEMDGFSVNSGIVVIAATNREEVLDPALLRPGRFDRQVFVGAPDINGREEILKVHARLVPLAATVDLRIIARGTPGFSGADLANLVNEAAILAARANKAAVEMSDFDAARDKVVMGAEKKSMVLSEQSKLSTAYHEAGHVMVAKLVPGCDPVHKVSIIPRGRALGVTLQIPEEDKHCYTREMLIAHIKVLMGGRAAEDLVFNTTTTGAGNDLARATDVARKMVSEWGMSTVFGPVAFGHQEATAEGNRARSCSDATALKIDEEIRNIVTTAYGEVRDLLQNNMPTLKLLTEELVARETLLSTEIDALLAPVPAVSPAGTQAAAI